MPEVVDLSDRLRPHRFWQAAAGWTVVATVVALILRAQDGLPLARAILSTSVWYYSLGALVWAACALDVRWNLWKRTPAQTLFAHAALALAAISVWAAAIVTFSRLSIGPEYWDVVFGDWWGFQFLTTAVLYAGGVAVGLAVRSSDRERERQQREAQLEVLAREAELTAIKAQLQPHFLFNSLNSILALIDHDPAEARHMLTRLASLLHSVFDRLDEPLVPLERELETIRDYLDIERIRFGDRLTFSIDADSAARRVPVPPFLLQPIVENAVKHGIEPHPKPGAVRVTGRLDGPRLYLSVADTGPAANGGDPSVRSGRGLALTRRRLRAVYGGDAATIRTERSADGFTVTLALPPSDVV
jgi:two-component system LytT family sensor kinase